MPHGGEKLCLNAPPARAVRPAPRTVPPGAFDGGAGDVLAAVVEGYVEGQASAAVRG